MPGCGRYGASKQESIEAVILHVAGRWTRRLRQGDGARTPPGLGAGWPKIQWGAVVACYGPACARNPREHAS